jgi:hypothetical protein
MICEASATPSGTLSRVLRVAYFKGMPHKDDDELGVVDSTGLTDADWAEINELKRAHKEGGQKALWAAANELIDRDAVLGMRILEALFPNEVREAIKDGMAELGMTEEDLRDLRAKIESPAGKQ